MNNEPNAKEAYDARKAEKERALAAQDRVRLGKRLGLWVIGFVGIAVVIFGLVKLGGEDGTGGTASLINAVSPQDFVQGNSAAPVTLIEYSDFQCPACASYYPLLKELMTKDGDRIQFVYRHFPLPQHKNARLAAQAAEAAGKQSKFWEMHDLLFGNQEKWAESGKAKDMFLEYANELKLDAAIFSNDLDASEIKAKIEADYNGGVAAGINSTPSFFVNGSKIQNPRSLDEFEQLINQRTPANP